MEQSEIELRAKVLAAPAYRQRLELLFELYEYSRGSRDNPARLLLIQEGLGQLLKSYQEKKREFERENSEVGVAVVKRLMKVLQDITDGIAWRSLRYDRLLVQQLAAKPKTGYLDDTFIDNVNLAARIILGGSKSLVLINDLTRVLRHGDLTVIEDKNVKVIENKSGRASKDNRRATRQKHNIKELVGLFNTGVRVQNGQRVLLTRLDIPVHTYLPQVGKLISQAQSDGYAQAQFSDCVAAEAQSTKCRPQKAAPRPFTGTEHVASHNNLMLFDQTATRHAPYTIFPFDAKTCFDLATGDTFLSTYLNIEALQSCFKNAGISLEFPDVESLRSYALSPIVERKRRMGQLRLVARHRESSKYLLFDPDLLSLVEIEFFAEDTFVNAIRHIMEESQLREEEHLIVYMALDKEAGLWD
jgi:hypothetical protein